MSYNVEPLHFQDDKIYFFDEGKTEHQIMMNWESELMSGSAAYITQNGGDILEIGFGMGISAGYIQSHSITSHTIVENHPDIIPIAKEWALNKPNITIVTGSWYDNLDNLGVYDGIFYDTYGDHHLHFFKDSISSLARTGSLVTWWNSMKSKTNLFFNEGVTYQEFDINPPKNSYYNHTKYFLPKKQF